MCILGRYRGQKVSVRSVRKSGQQGQAMVETALMISVVVLLLMGIIEFGFLFYAHVRVSNAAREGARAGSLWGMRAEASLCTAVDNAVQGEVTGIPGSYTLEIALDTGTVACPDAAGSVVTHAGEPITVTVTYDFDLPVVTALPIIRDVIPSPYPVSRTTVMRFQ